MGLAASIGANLEVSRQSRPYHDSDRVLNLVNTLMPSEPMDANNNVLPPGSRGAIELCWVRDREWRLVAPCRLGPAELQPGGLG